MIIIALEIKRTITVIIAEIMSSIISTSTIVITMIIIIIMMIITMTMIMMMKIMLLTDAVDAYRVEGEMCPVIHG